MSENTNTARKVTPVTITVTRTNTTNVSVTGLSSEETEARIESWISGILKGVRTYGSDEYGESEPYFSYSSKEYRDYDPDPDEAWDAQCRHFARQ